MNGEGWRILVSVSSCEEDEGIGVRGGKGLYGSAGTGRACIAIIMYCIIVKSCLD